ncbi:CheY-like receiver domain-containing protein [Leptolyngbya sp. PCC 7375]|nr:CheY-like receiver domain-containing protein [Leptolyngbya sp. PCC 7375]
MALLTKPTLKRLPCLLPRLRPDQPPCRVLVVDDHPVNRTLLMRLLQRSGFAVSQAVNGADAFTRWEQWQPQLIFMDLLMPGMDGREATRLIRTAETMEQRQNLTKIIALTAQPALACAHQVNVGGFDDIITKPIRPYTMFELIAQYLDLQYIYSCSEEWSAS